MTDSEDNLYVRLQAVHRRLVNTGENALGDDTRDDERCLWRAVGTRRESEDISWSSFQPSEFATIDSECADSRAEYFFVDGNQFLFLPLSRDDVRGVDHSMNMISEGAEWAGFSYFAPEKGAFAFVDLAKRNREIEIAPGMTFSLDKDGSIRERVHIQQGRCFKAGSLRGALAGVTIDGVIQGWATILTDRTCPVPLTISVDGVIVANALATDQYDSSASIKQFTFNLPQSALDGRIHKLEIMFSGSGEPLGGCPAYICGLNREILVISDVHIDGSTFSADAMVVDGVESHEQCETISRARVRQTQKILTSSSWVLTAPVRYLSARAKGRRLAPISPEHVTVENAQLIHDALLSTQSWRLSAPIRMVEQAIGRGELDGKSDPQRVFGPRLRYAVSGPSGSSSTLIADNCRISERSFSRGYDRITAQIGRDIEKYDLKLMRPSGEEIATVSLADFSR